MGAPAGDAVVRAQTQPRSKVFGACELAHVGADFAQERQDGLDAHSFDDGEIDSELGKEVLAHRFVGDLVSLLVRRRWGGLSLVFEGTYVPGDLLVAVGHELLVEAPGFEGLAQGKEMFLAPVAIEGFGDLSFALLATIVAMAGEHLGVALARHDGVEDGHTGEPGDVGNRVMQLHVHLVERLLHAQQVLAAGAHQALAVAHERAHRADRGGRPEGCVEQAHAVQVLQPLAVLHIALASGHVLDVAGVDEADLKAVVLQDLEERDPVDPGGLLVNDNYSSPFGDSYNSPFSGTCSPLVFVGFLC